MKIEKYLKVEPGDIIQFSGCCWDEHWEFDAPVIIYEPVLYYGFDGSICKETIVEKIEDICIDICCNENNLYRIELSDEEKKEFKWRRWTVNKIKNKKNAIHHSIKIEFYNKWVEDDRNLPIQEMSFRFENEKDFGKGNIDNYEEIKQKGKRVYINSAVAISNTNPERNN